MGASDADDCTAAATPPGRAVGLPLGPVLALALWLVGPPAGFGDPAWLTAALTLLMAGWWMTGTVAGPRPRGGA